MTEQGMNQIIGTMKATQQRVASLEQMQTALGQAGLDQQVFMGLVEGATATGFSVRILAGRSRTSTGWVVDAITIDPEAVPSTGSYVSVVVSRHGAPFIVAGSGSGGGVGERSYIGWGIAGT